jgi:hypothetical protein
MRSPGGFVGGSTGGSQAPSPKSHPKVEGKIARSARLYKVVAVDPRCYEHTFVLDFRGRRIFLPRWLASPLGWAAAEAELVAIYIAIDHLAYTVRVRLLLGRFNPARTDLRHERVQIIKPKSGCSRHQAHRGLPR